MKQHAEKCSFKDTQECDCDCYHTFGELYEHRYALWIKICEMSHFLCQKMPSKISYGHMPWRTKKHSDGEVCFGTGTQFVLGIGAEKGKQITYHLPIEKWDECDFAETLEQAPEYDGHTSDDVLERLKEI